MYLYLALKQPKGKTEATNLYYISPPFARKKYIPIYHQHRPILILPNPLTLLTPVQTLHTLYLYMAPFILQPKP